MTLKETAIPFQDLSEKGQTVRKMFDEIAPTYDRLNRLLSFQQDVRWRNRIFQSISNQENSQLLDVACGTGDILRMAEKKLNRFSKFVGVDISKEMLNVCEKKIQQNISELNQNKFYLIQASAEQLPLESNTFDVVTISFGFRNVDNRPQALKEFLRVLKPKGQLFILDFFEPKQSLFSKFFLFYFHSILPTLGNLLSKHKNAYSYLPKSVATMPPQKIFEEMLCENGFSFIKCESFLFGGVRLFQVQKN